MSKLWCLLFFLSDVNFVLSQTVRNVRLIDHTSYAISILQKTMSKVEERCWCNLKVDDMHFHVNETVLNRVIFADIDLTDGFVVSLQKISIVQHTIQQVWLSRSANDANVEIRATLRMEDVSIGFDVKTEMDNKITHTTGVMIYPLITFAFTISKHLFTDEITVRVVSEVVRTTNVMTFTPETDVTRVFTRLFPWNSPGLLTSVARWASDTFAPITLELATKEFPTICYDCPV